MRSLKGISAGWMKTGRVGCYSRAWDDMRIPLSPVKVPKKTEDEGGAESAVVIHAPFSSFQKIF